MVSCPGAKVWISFLLVTIGLVVGAAGFYKVARAKYRQVTAQMSRLEQGIAKNNLLLEGFRHHLSLEAQAIEDTCPRLLFAGHIYPQNGLRAKTKPRFSAVWKPMPHLLNLVKNGDFLLAIFGGDSIYLPTKEGLEHLAQLQEQMPQSRFLLGNHEAYWQSALRQDPAQFSAIFRGRYGFDDIHGVRLVYLHTVEADGSYGLDDEQRDFLQMALAGADYGYALIFLHHALWAGESRFTNVRYPNAERLRQDWLEAILPRFVVGRVKGVFAGDGGDHQPGIGMSIMGIPHFISGWPRYRADILYEWLSIGLCDSEPVVNRYKLFDDELYLRNEYPIHISN